MYLQAKSQQKDNYRRRRATVSIVTSGVRDHITTYFEETGIGSLFRLEILPIYSLSNVGYSIIFFNQIEHH